MSEWSAALLNVHFLRPDWLAGIPVAALLLLWQARRQQVAARWRGRIAPHLLTHLIVRPPRRSAPGPATWLFALLSLSCLALAGPCWERTPSPFSKDSAALVIVLDLAPSMLEDAPSRLLRARLKLRDLLALRQDQKTALIALGPTAHRVLPFTRDAQAIRSYLDVLSPRLMPPAQPSRQPGQRFLEALALADAMLAREDGTGSVLLVTDNPPPDLPATALPVVWTISTGQPPRLAWADSSIGWTVDASDVAAVNRALARRLEAARQSESASNQWRDGGIVLLAPLVLLALIGARRGWSLRW
jgi:Ca-activated chloride channel family protein